MFSNQVGRIAKSARNRLAIAILRARSLRLRFWAFFGCLRIGRRLLAGRSVEVVVYGSLQIGDDVHLDDGCKLQVGPNARLVLGDRVYLGRGTVVVAAQLVEIGSFTLVAEHCSIRDSDHQMDPKERRGEKTSVTAPVRIGRDVWVAAGCRVLRGSRMGDGSVLGANSVLRGDVPDRSLAVGAPARVVRRP